MARSPVKNQPRRIPTAITLAPDTVRRLDNLSANLMGRPSRSALIEDAVEVMLRANAELAKDRPEPSAQAVQA